jgi:hypothetical protein
MSMEEIEKIFLKEQEVSEFKKLQEKINGIIYNMGEIAVEKQILMEKETNVLSVFNKIRKEESTFMKKIERNYGSGIINPETYEFTKQD